MKIVERITLHVSDDTGRIAMLENRTYGTAANDNNTAPSLIRYIYSNHLQSSSLELDGSAAIISYEEYHLYGTTSYQAMNASIQAVAKRYRYTGKERDEESGLYYHGARYYIPWLCRWTAVDPLESKYAGMSPYNYSFNNPVMFNDPSGADPYKYNPPSTVDATRVDPSPLQKWAPPEGYAGVELEEVVIKENPEMTPLETRDGPILSYGERMENAGALRQEVFENKVNSEREQMLKNMYLDEPHISADQNGNGVTWTRRGLAWQEYQANEAWGESLRSGNTGTAVGTIFGGREGGMKGAVVGDVLMSFASVGTPYGKVEPIKISDSRSLPLTEAQRNPMQNVDNFISQHAFARHRFDPSRVSTRSRTQYGETINTTQIFQETINNPREIVPQYNEHGIHFANTYKKTFDFNISTNATPTYESRVIINFIDQSKSSQFPYFKKPNININGYR